MKTVGVIAEYNPLHNGHRYQLEQARMLSGADFVIVVMSGDFVQRGEPAVYDKYTRTHMALNAGADLVLELPSCFATGSAEDFASCGIALLNRIGVTDFLCFGSECGDIRPLYDAAVILAEEPENYKRVLKNGLSSGLAFPKARANALLSMLSADGAADWESILSSPNNLLGMEYIKAILRSGSRIQPLTIERSGYGYHDTDFSDASAFASASAIRKALSEGSSASVQNQMPDFSSASIHDRMPVFPDDISELLNYRLLDLNHSGTALTLFSDVSKELSDRLDRQLLDFSGFTGRIQSLKTKQYTYTRISRVLLHILLGIRDDDMKVFRASGYAGYARVLGFKKSAIPLLSEIKTRSAIPLITKTANAAKILKEYPAAWRAFQYDLHAAHVYQTIQYHKTNNLSKNEFTSPVIILD